MSTKHDTYTLWVKFKNRGWIPLITAKATDPCYLSPYSFLSDFAKRVYKDLSYYQRGKTWMVKPEGQKPAELLAKG